MKKPTINQFMMSAVALSCLLGVAATAAGRGGGGGGTPHISDADLKMPPGVSRHEDGSLPWAFTIPSAPADREAMLVKLGIDRTRRGLDATVSTAPQDANYSEDHVDEWPAGYLEVNKKPRPPHASTTLPDMMVCKDGTKVTDAKTWIEKRRPEIIEDFEREVYGRIPKNAPKVTWTVGPTTVNGNVKTKTARGKIDTSAFPSVTVQDIVVTVNTPANATGPVPLIMTYGGGGGGGFGMGPGEEDGLQQTAFGDAIEGFSFDLASMNPFTSIVDSRQKLYTIAAPAPADAGGAPATPVPGGAPGARGGRGGGGGRGAGGGGGGPASFYAKGWGTATISTAFQPSNWSSGVLALCREGKERQPDEWGVLRAWGWGVSRAMDYFETDNDVDAKAVTLEGHSFQGKACIVSAVFEPRLFTAFVSSSGMGGAKIWRRNYGEPLEGICGTGEYYEICGNLMKYAGPLTSDDLPVDAHEFIALMAPRPIFISGGITAQNGGDGWQDPRGMFLACEAASPAWELLGKKGLTDKDGKRIHDFPVVETPLIFGECAYREHSGGHTDGPNWPTFVEFCSHYFKVNPPAGPAPTP